MGRVYYMDIRIRRFCLSNTQYSQCFEFIKNKKGERGNTPIPATKSVSLLCRRQIWSIGNTFLRVKFTNSSNFGALLMLTCTEEERMHCSDLMCHLKLLVCVWVLNKLLIWQNVHLFSYQIRKCATGRRILSTQVYSNSFRSLTTLSHALPGSYTTRGTAEAHCFSLFYQ